MSQLPANDDANLQELVAYLDGELSADESRQIEERAASDPDVHRTLHELDRTWHMLDDLDQPAMGEDFTCTTMEMVAVAAAEEAAHAESEIPRKKRRYWLLATAGLAAAALAGFLGVAFLAPDPNAQLVQDLPILENFDQYRQIDNIDFLKRLSAEKLFTEEVDDGQ